MNAFVLQMIIALAEQAPNIIADIQAAAKAVETDPSAQQKLKDILSAVEQLAGIAVKVL